MEQHPWVCPKCTQALSPDDTVVFEQGRPAHLDCRRFRALSPEERLLLFAYCQEHAVAECRVCAKRFRLRDLDSDLISSRVEMDDWCHRDLTDSIRIHIYGCALVPEDVRRMAQTARETAQRVVKQPHELRDAADVLMREAEAALHALRETMRPARMVNTTSETEAKERQIRPFSYRPLPIKLQVGDRFSDDTGEWRIVSKPHSLADGKNVHTRVQRIDQPAVVEDRTWVADKRIRVKRATVADDKG